MKEKIKKHAAPLGCRVEVWFRGPSPSNMINCGLGARGCRRCARCEQNRREIASEALAAAFARLSESAVKAAKALERAVFSLKITTLPQIYELAEEEPEEEDAPMPKQNPYLK